MAEKKLLLRSCCFGCSLRIGSLIVAILSLILGFIGLGLSIFAGLNGSAGGWLNVAINVFNIVLSALLIHGIKTEQHRFVLAWVWTTMVTVILTVFLGVFVILLSSSVTEGVILFAFALIQTYFILVVRSYSATLESLELPVSH
ncbi:uncharacterized protein LOC135199843 [Macrobrachium nipponense]|uniref:uncharacterized protein LOC135199843 n=1 Tax=Macrobrachium nipponense TaxID=159736 RepID=UPI0030C829CD